MESAGSVPDFTVVGGLAAQLNALDDPAWHASTKRVSEIVDSVLQGASTTTEGTTAEVLLGLARSFAMVWMQVGGNSEEVARAFTECAVISGTMVLSETLGRRLKGPDLITAVKQAAEEAANAAAEAQKAG